MLQNKWDLRYGYNKHLLHNTCFFLEFQWIFWKILKIYWKLSPRSLSWHLFCFFPNIPSQGFQNHFSDLRAATSGIALAWLFVDKTSNTSYFIKKLQIRSFTEAFKRSCLLCVVGLRKNVVFSL